MTQEQEEQLRIISKFLRSIFAKDMSACATILTAEAELLEGSDIEKNADILLKVLNVVSNYCETLIFIVKKLKENKL